MFRRLRSSRRLARSLDPDQMAILKQANQWMENGEPAKAAPLFAQLANEMKMGRHPRRAANMYARAAHAFADANNEPAALAHTRSALELFSALSMFQRTPVFFANITRHLINRGMKSSADELQREYGSLVSSQPSQSPQMKQPQHGLLPTNCPKCGAPVQREDINWVDENTAECEFCGTFMRTEN
jgi:hypothetical protein